MRSRSPRRSRLCGERGYAMAALLVGLSIMSVMLGMALPVWRTWMQREREAELIFRGEQYAQAINLFSRRTGGFPTSFDALRDGKYIRKLYKDPITNGDFQPVYLGQIATQTPTAPGRGGVGLPAGAPGPAAGRGLQPGGAQMGRGFPSATPAPAPAQGGQPFGGTPGPTQGGQPFGGTLRPPGAGGAGPIIGVVSRSTGESLRQYNGRGRYNEWIFVSTAATVQAGAPDAGPPPGVPDPGPGGRGRGVEPGAGRRGLPMPGRGGFPQPPGRGGFPQPPGGRGRL